MHDGVSKTPEAEAPKVLHREVSTPSRWFFSGGFMQSRLGSMMEAIASTAIGYGVAVVSNLLLLPIFGFQPTLHEASSLALLFTGISLVRGYLVRRLFNWITLHANNRNLKDRHPSGTPAP